jgi:hypothetical protein
VSSDHPKLRYVCSWGAQEIVDGRARMTDEEWTRLGAAEDDEEYYDRFEAAFDLDIRPR